MSLWKEQTYKMLERTYGIDLKSLGDTLREQWEYMKVLTGSLGERANMDKGRDRTGSNMWADGDAGLT